MSDYVQASTSDVQAQNQDQPPVSTIVTVSSPTCALSGKPPFVITTTYQCTESKPIWALVCLWADVGGGSEIRDPLRNHRRIGCLSAIIADDYDEVAYDLADTQLVHLMPSQKFSTTYTVTVVPKANGLRPSDTYKMIKGNTYEITLRERRWRWMLEEDMGVDLSEEERRKLLEKRKAMVWNVDCKVDIKAD